MAHVGEDVTTEKTVKKQREKWPINIIQVDAMGGEHFEDLEKLCVTLRNPNMEAVVCFEGICSSVNPDRDWSDLPAQGDLFKRLADLLPYHTKYFHARSDGIDPGLNYHLSEGLAIFVPPSLSGFVERVSDHFVDGNRIKTGGSQQIFHPASMLQYAFMRFPGNRVLAICNVYMEGNVNTKEDVMTEYQRLGGIASLLRRFPPACSVILCGRFGFLTDNCEHEIITARGKHLRNLLHDKGITNTQSKKCGKGRPSLFYYMFVSESLDVENFSPLHGFDISEYLPLHVKVNV